MNFLKKPAAKAATSVPSSLGSPTAPAKPNPTAAPNTRPSSGLEAKPAAGAAPLRSVTISQEAIAQAAYFRWQRFGGDEASNWTLAEQELRDEAKKLGITV